MNWEEKYLAIVELVDGYRRERDEARADARRWRESREERNDEANNIQRALNRAARERDEAREQLYLTKAELGRWVDRETKAVRERDEWRDKFFALNQTAGELCNACGWAFRIPGEPCRCEVVKERDEARASLAQIRRVFGNAIAFDDARGDIVKMAEIAYRGACDGDKAVGELRGMTRQRDEARAEVKRLREALEASEEP